MFSLKNISVVFLLSVSFLNASTCSYAKEQAEHYAVKANNYSMDTISGACSIADNLEQVVNWMGTMKQNGCISFNSTTFQMYVSMLMAASTKCGH